MYRILATVLGRRRARRLSDRSARAGAAADADAQQPGEGADAAPHVALAASVCAPPFAAERFELRVRVEGPAVPGLAPPGEPAVRELRVHRRGPRAAFARGATIVLSPREVRALYPVAADGEARVGEERLSGPWLEATCLPHLAGRVSRLALRSTGFAPIAVGPTLGIEGGCDLGGVADALATWKRPGPGWDATYKWAPVSAVRARVRGRVDDVAFDRGLELCAWAPLLLVDAKVARRGKRKGSGAAEPPPRYEARIALASPRRAPVEVLWSDGVEAARLEAARDPAVIHPFRPGDVERASLAAGTLVVAQGGSGATVLFGDPERLTHATILIDRGCVAVRAPFPGDGEAAAYALALCERVAVSPRGVLCAASAAPDADGLSRVVVWLRDLDAPADAPVAAEVGGRPLPLLPRPVPGAGRLHVGELRLTPDAWREARALVRVGEGEYRL